jgi:tetratricopeptide (TPR) repeat protein
VDAESQGRAVIDFLQHDLLAQASSAEQLKTWPQASPHPDLKVLTLLDRAADRIGSKFSCQPLVEATIHETIGSAYNELGRHAKAMHHLERALDLRKRLQGEAAPETLRPMTDLYFACFWWGDVRPALRLGEETLGLHRKILGEEHPETLRVMIYLGYLYSTIIRNKEAESLLTTGVALSRRRLGEEHPTTLFGMSILGDCYIAQGRLAEAEPLLRKSFDISPRVLGEERLETVFAMNRLGYLHLLRGKLAEAEPLITRSAEACRRVRGDEDAFTHTMTLALGDLYVAQGRYAPAESLLARGLEVCRRVRGDEDNSTQLFTLSLANLYSLQGRFSLATSLLERAVEDLRRVRGDDYGTTIVAMNNLAWFLASSPDSSKSQNAVRAVELARKVVTAAPQQGNFRNTLGAALYRAGAFREAIAVLEEAMELKGGGDCCDWFFLCMAHRGLGNLDQAREWFQKAVQFMEKNNLTDPELLRFRSEASALLGVKEPPRMAPK